jgi:hypothetical protein
VTFLDSPDGGSFFKERYELIDAILTQEQMAFRPDMTRDEEEQLDVERQFWVIQHGLNSMSLEKLRAHIRS